MSWKRFCGIASLKKDVFIKGLPLQYWLSSCLTTIPVSIYRDMNALIFSIDTSFHILKRKGGGNSRFTCMYWAAYRFVCVARRLKNSSFRNKSIKSIVSGSSESSALILLAVNSDIVEVLSFCLQTSSSHSSSSCFFDESMKALHKRSLVWGPVFLTGNVGGATAMLPTSSSNDDSVKESEGNPSNFGPLPENMPWSTSSVDGGFFDMFLH